jgi:hypothetical protein
MAITLDRPSIEFLILADRAEAINGKLYMMGGAWDRLGVKDFNAPVSLGMAIGVLIPWMATNVEHVLNVHLEHEDGTTIGSQVQGRLNTGRPPNAVPGQSFMVTVTIIGEWKLPEPGTYRVVASFQDDAPKMVVFHAVAAT